MSKFMPPKPQFGAALMRTLGGGDERLVRCILEHQFNAWWDKEIVQLFQNSVEVYSPDDLNGWMRSRARNYTHSALIVNIQPIKKDTAEDILKQIIHSFEGPEYLEDLRPIIDRAKKILEGE